jgi:hypothetical protein
VNDNEQSGGTSASRSEPLISRVKDIIHGSHWQTVWEVAEEVEIPVGSCHTILTEDYECVGSWHNLCQDSWAICSRISSEQQMTKISWKLSLPVMRHGFTVVTVKSNDSLHTGSALLHLAPSKHDRCALQMKAVLLLFIIEMLCVTNSLLKVRQLIKICNY